MRNEAQTRFELVDPCLMDRGWPRGSIRLEETPGAIDIIYGKPQRRPKLLRHLQDEAAPRHKITVITFNYDMAIDVALSQGHWRSHLINNIQAQSQ